MSNRPIVVLKPFDKFTEHGFNGRIASGDCFFRSLQIGFRFWNEGICQGFTKVRAIDDTMGT